MKKKATPIYTKDQVFIEDFDRRKKIEIKFEILNVFYNKSGYSIFSARIIENDQSVLFSQNISSIKGNIINPRKGDQYWAKGNVIYDEEYGYGIDIKKTAELIYPRSRKEIIKFIQNNITGLGKVRATKIVDHLGENTLQTLEINPEALDHIPDFKVTAGIKKEIIEKISSGKSINDTMVLLTSMNLPESLAFDIFEKYGVNSATQLEYNPYIISDIKPLLWPQSDKFFKKQFDLNKDGINFRNHTGSAMRYRSAIKFYLKLALDMTGSLAVKKDKIFKDFNSGEFLNSYGSFPDHENNRPNHEIIEKHLDHMAKEGTIVIVKSKKKEEYVYMQNSYFAEQKIVKLIRKFNKNSTRIATTEETKEFIDLYEKQTGYELASKQRLAVDLLVNNKISILTGGPGTGKTTTLSAVTSFIDYLYELKIIPSNEISLLAPTGKAARRMSEVLDLTAGTIHRKLKLKGFGQDEEPAEISERFVIVDESSMIDIHLFSQLLESLSSESNLLIVGDEHQLPSIGAGLVLRDLIESNKVKTVLLDEVFRQKQNSLLINNANKMKDGVGITDTDISLQFETKTEGKLKDSYFVEAEESWQVKDYLLSMVNKFTKTYNEQIKDIMILTAQNIGTLGTWELNKEIQSIYNKNYNSDVVVIRKYDNMAFYIGDPVMQLINDYTNEVFNGEIGVISDINLSNGKYEIEVEYPDHDLPVYYTGSLINDITLAYAITYHKSQGSESKLVIQLVDHSQKNMLDRSLIYTGYTRSRETNVILGQVDTFNDAIKNIENLKRSSLIKEKL